MVLDWERGRLARIECKCAFDAGETPAFPVSGELFNGPLERFSNPLNKGVFGSDF